MAGSPPLGVLLYLRRVVEHAGATRDHQRAGGGRGLARVDEAGVSRLSEVGQDPLRPRGRRNFAFDSNCMRHRPDARRALAAALLRSLWRAQNLDVTAGRLQATHLASAAASMNTRSWRRRRVSRSRWLKRWTLTTKYRTHPQIGQRQSPFVGCQRAGAAAAHGLGGTPPTHAAR